MEKDDRKKGELVVKEVDKKKWYISTGSKMAYP